jgi:hypothetical protein
MGMAFPKLSLKITGFNLARSCISVPRLGLASSLVTVHTDIGWHGPARIGWRS